MKKIIDYPILILIITGIRNQKASCLEIYLNSLLSCCILQCDDRIEQRFIEICNERIDCLRCSLGKTHDAIR